MTGSTMQSKTSIVTTYMNGNLILQIVIGMLLGIAVGLISSAFSEDLVKSFYPNFYLLGDLFIKALQAVAPILVFVLVIAAITNQKPNSNSRIKPIITLYLLGTFLAALAAVLMSFIFQPEILLEAPKKDIAPPNGVWEVIQNLLFKVVDNPINALADANYIGILAWAIALGLVCRHANTSTKTFFVDVSAGVSTIVRFIVRLAPFGVFGLVTKVVTDTGISGLASYGSLLGVLVGTMLFMALIVNPILVYWKTKTNPYPLVFKCLQESGSTAFFTRSSAANIPVNMDLCKKLELDEETYSVSIPLGATINMAGAAITITVLTLAAANTLNVEYDFLTALLLCLVAAVSACGASGVAGGSLLLIPIACSLFNIPAELSHQVLGAGMVIAIVQDSAETALNSSTDVLFTAAACRAESS